MVTVDILAEGLSKSTGAKWEILRGRVPATRFRGRKQTTVLRYQVAVSRDGFRHVFGRPAPLNEVTRWLASISDMRWMGFLSDG